MKSVLKAILLQSVDSAWKQLASRGIPDSMLRLDEDSPANLYAAIDSSGRLGLIAMSTGKPIVIEPFSAVDVLWESRGTHFQLEIWLKDSHLSNLFGSLCNDLNSYTSQPSNESAILRLVGRLESWRRLLELGQRGLDRSATRGLIGELTTIEHLINVLPAVDVILGWNGGLPASHDFIFDGFHLEVKTVGLNANAVKISSLEQLATQYDFRLFLTVAFLFESDAEFERGFTVSMLIQRIKSKLPVVLHPAFEAKILERGIDSIVDSKTWYRLDAHRFFLIREAFPKITRDTVSADVLSASYTLALSGIEPFEVALEQYL